MAQPLLGTSTQAKAVIGYWWPHWPKVHTKPGTGTLTLALILVQILISLVTAYGYGTMYGLDGYGVVTWFAIPLASAAVVTAVRVALVTGIHTGEPGWRHDGQRRPKAKQPADPLQPGWHPGDVEPTKPRRPWLHALWAVPLTVALHVLVVWENLPQPILIQVINFGTPAPWVAVMVTLTLTGQLALALLTHALLRWATRVTTYLRTGLRRRTASNDQPPTGPILILGGTLLAAAVAWPLTLATWLFLDPGQWRAVLGLVKPTLITGLVALVAFRWFAGGIYERLHRHRR